VRFTGGSLLDCVTGAFTAREAVTS